MYHTEIERSGESIALPYPMHDLIRFWVIITAPPGKKKEWRSAEARCFDQT